MAAEPISRINSSNLPERTYGTTSKYFKILKRKCKNVEMNKEIMSHNVLEKMKTKRMKRNGMDYER